jgi:hypothetical protein
MHIAHFYSNQQSQPTRKHTSQVTKLLLYNKLPKITIMKYLSLLALVSTSAVLAQSLNRNFTINLLTDDQYLSIVKLPPSEDQTPIGLSNPIATTTYNDITYSVVGSFNFTELNVGQAFHIDNDLWSVDVSSPAFVASKIPVLIIRSTCPLPKLVTTIPLCHRTSLLEST